MLAVTLVLGVHTCVHTGSAVPHVSLITGNRGGRPGGGPGPQCQDHWGPGGAVLPKEACWANSQVTPCLSVDCKGTWARE